MGNGECFVRTLMTVTKMAFKLNTFLDKCKIFTRCAMCRLPFNIESENSAPAEFPCRKQKQNEKKKRVVIQYDYVSAFLARFRSFCFYL